MVGHGLEQEQHSEPGDSDNRHGHHVIDVVLQQIARKTTAIAHVLRHKADRRDQRNIEAELFEKLKIQPFILLTCHSFWNVTWMT